MDCTSNKKAPLRAVKTVAAEPVGLALDLEDYHPSVLLHCWLGHLTCKIVSEMTYKCVEWDVKPYNTIRYRSENATLTA